MNKCFLFFGLLFWSCLTQAQGINFESDTWSKVVQKAKTQNKLIFFDAYTTWCGPCKALQARVFPDKKLGDFYNTKFVNVKMDMESSEGLSLANKYPVRGYPTLMFIDPKTGKIVNTVLGYKTPEQLLQLAEQTLKKQTN